MIQATILRPLNMRSFVFDIIVLINNYDTNIDKFLFLNNKNIIFIDKNLNKNDLLK
tara:strand:+ start:95675 stop:95842 length:168 start_codon:yes stop_codon:yes gene_type:complete